MFHDVLVPRIDFRLLVKDLLFIHSCSFIREFLFSTYFYILFRPVAQYIIDVSLVVNSDEQTSEIIMKL